MGTIVTSVYTVQNTTSLQKDTVNQSVKKKKILPSLPPKLNFPFPFLSARTVKSLRNCVTN